MLGLVKNSTQPTDLSVAVSADADRHGLQHQHHDGEDDEAADRGADPRFHRLVQARGAAAELADGPLPLEKGDYGKSDGLPAAVGNLKREHGADPSVIPAYLSERNALLFLSP